MRCHREAVAKTMRCSHQLIKVEAELVQVTEFGMAHNHGPNGPNQFPFPLLKAEELHFQYGRHGTARSGITH